MWFVVVHAVAANFVVVVVALATIAASAGTVFVVDIVDADDNVFGDFILCLYFHRWIFGICNFSIRKFINLFQFFFLI